MVGGIKFELKECAVFDDVGMLRVWTVLEDCKLFVGILVTETSDEVVEWTYEMKSEELFCISKVGESVKNTEIALVCVCINENEWLKVVVGVKMIMLVWVGSKIEEWDDLSIVE